MNTITRPRAAAALIILALIPVALTVWIGAPIPRALPTSEQIAELLRGVTTGHLLAALRILLWLAWLLAVTGTIWELATTRSANRDSRSQNPKRSTLRLIGMAILGTGAAASTIITATPAAAAAAPDTDTDTEPERHESQATRDKTHATATSDDDHTYTVHTGDSLWSIAEAELNDGSKWSQLYELNTQRPQPDGERMTDANTIQPGWKLLLRQSTASNAPDTAPPPEDTPRSPSQPLTPPHAPTDSETPSIQAEPTHDQAGQSDQSATTDSHTWSGSVVKLGTATVLAFGAAIGIVATVRAARRRIRDYYARTAVPRNDTGTDAVDANMALTGTLAPLEPLTHHHSLNAPATALLIGTGQHDVPITLTDLDTAHVCLRGPGAASAARAAVISTIASHGDHGHASVVMTQDALATLDDDFDTGWINRLVIVEDTDTLLHTLQVETLQRTRLHDSHDPTAAQPPLLVVTNTHHTDVTESLHQCAHLGVYNIHLGDEADNATTAAITVDEDGAVTGHPHLQRCYLTDSTEWRNILTSLHAAARTREEPITTPPQDDSDDRSDATGSQPDGEAPQNPAADEPSSERTRSSTNDTNTPAEGTDQRDVIADTGAVAVPHQPTVTGTASMKFRLRLFGPVTITYGNEPVPLKRTRAKELLARLATAPEGMRHDSLLDLIVGDIRIHQASGHFNMVVSTTRKTLRTAADQPKTEMFIVYDDTHRLYTLDPAWFDIDTNHFDEHLAHASANADNQDRRIHHLTQALDLYSGDVAADMDTDGLWAEPIRQHYRDRTHTTCLRLAEHWQHHDPNHAASLLERAIDINPHQREAFDLLEDLYTTLDRTSDKQRIQRQRRSLDREHDPTN